MTLQVRNLTKRYGANTAMDGVSMSFAPGKIHTLIGPNGAGKSTFVNLVAGSYSLTEGEVILDGKRLDGLPKHKINLAGISRTYQNIRLFDRMSVIDNLDVCHFPTDHGSILRDVFRWKRSAARAQERLERCRSILAQFDLEQLAETQASLLSYGRQRMLEIARALIVRPRVLILDEPAAGLNEAETQELRDRLNAMRSDDLIIIVIEHDMDLVMAISDEVHVLHNGKLLFEGIPEAVRNNPSVQEAYLGTEDELEEIRKLAADRRAGRGIQH